MTDNEKQTVKINCNERAVQILHEKGRITASDIKTELNREGYDHVEQDNAIQHILELSHDRSAHIASDPICKIIDWDFTYWRID